MLNMLVSIQCVRLHMYSMGARLVVAMIRQITGIDSYSDDTAIFALKLAAFLLLQNPCLICVSLQLERRGGGEGI